MADSDKVSFLLDLDISEFTEKGLQAKGIIEQLGSAENLSGLLEGLTAAAPALAAVGVSAFAFKKALDWTIEGEQIERVNAQFEILSQQAGIVPEKLREGLEKSAKGLVDNDDLLKIANEAIVKMGGSAEKLPEIMEIARKSTAVYGGDAKTNFEAISEAISNGNVRMLKHYGIIIDATSAQKKFAEANGTTADQLSEAGRRQAILNAALESGNAAFKNVTENSQSATSTLQALKVTFSEIGEIFVLAFEKTIGPGIRVFLGSVQNLATKVKGYFEKEVAQESETAANRVIAASSKMTQASLIDQEKAKQAKLAFTKELEKIDQDYFKQQQMNVNSLDQIETLVERQREETYRQHVAKLEAIDANAHLNASQKKKLAAAENDRYDQQMMHADSDAAKLRTQLLDTYTSHATSAFDGIERSFRANTAKMKAEQADYGKQGNQMWNSLSANATQAFTNMGAEMVKGKDIGQATADALKGFFLGFLGDKAIAAGSVMLLESIWPPNPIGIAGGSALLALGGALKAAGGAGASGGTSISAPSPQAVAAGSSAPLVPVSSAASDQTNASGTDTSMASPAMEQQAVAQRSVSVHIAGNYLETDSTKRMLMDLMRQESDATGFNYTQIGA